MEGKARYFPQPSFYHAILSAFDKQYIVGDVKYREARVKSFRKQLTNLLNAPVNPLDPSSETYSQRASFRGKSLPRKITPSFINYVSCVIQKNIRIIGDDFPEICQGLPSIILIEDRGWNLVGYYDDEGEIHTIFS